MKEFNLEEAKAGKPVCTRDGRPARIIFWDMKSNEYPIVALVEENGEEIPETYSEKGVWQKGQESDFDLMMVTEKKKGWVNLYRDKSRAMAMEAVFDTEEEAKRYTCDSCFATIKIEWEE